VTENAVSNRLHFSAQAAGPTQSRRPVDTFRPLRVVLGVILKETVALVRMPVKMSDLCFKTYDHL